VKRFGFLRLVAVAPVVPHLAASPRSVLVADDMIAYRLMERLPSMLARSEELSLELIAWQRTYDRTWGTL
jgi:hypothetical protein